MLSLDASETPALRTLQLIRQAKSAARVSTSPEPAWKECDVAGREKRVHIEGHNPTRGTRRPRLPNHSQELGLLNVLFKIDQLPIESAAHHVTMKVSEKQTLSVRCPTCGARPGEKCELSTGLPRTDPHRDRRLAASDK